MAFAFAVDFALFVHIWITPTKQGLVFKEHSLQNISSSTDRKTSVIMNYYNCDSYVVDLRPRMFWDGLLKLSLVLKFESSSIVNSFCASTRYNSFPKKPVEFLIDVHRAAYPVYTKANTLQSKPWAHINRGCPVLFCRRCSSKKQVSRFRSLDIFIKSWHIKKVNSFWAKRFEASSIAVTMTAATYLILKPHCRNNEALVPLSYHWRACSWQRRAHHQSPR